MTFENIEDGGILFDKILKVLLKTFPTIYHTFDQKFKSDFNDIEEGDIFFYEKFLKRTFQYLFQRYITLRVFSHYLLLLINLFKIKTIITLMYLISLFLI